MAIDQAAMIRTIYDTIFSAYTQPPLPGLPPISQPSTTFLTLEWSGQQLDPAAFQNPWTPQNLNGSQLANELFAALVNPVPVLSATYADSGVTVEEMYKLMLLSSPDIQEGVNPVGTAFFEAEKTFEFAKMGSLLNPGLFYRPSYATPANWHDEKASRSWANVTIRSGQTRTIQNSPFVKLGGLERIKEGVWKIPTIADTIPNSALFNRLKKTMPADPAVRSSLISKVKLLDKATLEELPTYSKDQLAYQSAQDDYENAVANLNANRFQHDLSDPIQQQKWDADRPQLEAIVQSAWRNIQQQPTVDPDKANIKSIMDSIQSIPTQLSDEVIKSKFDKVMVPILSFATEVKRPMSRELQQIKEIQIIKQILSVASPTKPPLSKKLQQINAIQTVKQNKGILNYDLLKQYYNFQDVAIDQETSDLQISFRFCRVAVRRPWLMLSVLKLRGWHFAGQPAGSFSTGQVDINPGSFPLLPTAFIAIRDLRISGTWGKNDRSIAELAAAGTGNTVAFGPFALSGKYGTDQAGSIYNAKFDGQTLTVDGLQILGWINQVVPFSPPTAG
jgi:hypothetical protein